jgi:hypothetical protein
MVKEIIDKAIKTEGIIEMVYSKDVASNKFYRLYDIRYSADYGEKCISGKPLNSEKELTFRIDKIRDIQLVWDYIYEENVQFDKSGIYALSFMGDNYLEFGLYNYSKGEKLLDHYQFGLWAIQAFHYIPYYSGTNDNIWSPFDRAVKTTEDSIYVFAYTMEFGISVDWVKRFDFLLTDDPIKTTEHLGINYTARLVRKGDSFEHIKINENLNILAYCRFPNYSYDNLGVHNDIMWELYHNK